MPVREALPKKIGRYRVEAELGRGMMGAVYRAVDRRAKRAVAIKVIRPAFAVSGPELKTFERRFMAERRILARLDHPGIVAVHEVGHDKTLNCPYLALELLEGRTLRDVIRQKKRLDWRSAVGIVAGLARALHHAHEQGVVHRDVKPANIMILKDGSPKLMDFGIARLQEEARLTKTGEFLGTPLFMSPEQTRGEKVGPQSDIFSLGSVAYSLLTGQDAFAADSVPIQIDKIARFDPPPPSKLRRRIPGSLDYVLSRAMAKGTESRYASGELLAEDLEDVLAGKPPRHQAGWAAPEAPGEGTLVSPGRGTPPGRSPASAGGRSESPRRSRWKRRLGLLAASALVLVGVLFLSEFWNPRLRGLWEGDRSAEQERLLDSMAVAAREAGSRIKEGTDSLGTLIAGRAGGAPSSAGSARDEDVPRATREASSASGALVSPASVSSESTVPAPGSAWLSGTVEVTDELPEAELRLWVDDVLVFEGDMRAGPATLALVFRAAEGGYHGVAPVQPGERSLRVRVAGGGHDFTRTISGLFVDGGSRHLDVTVAPRGEGLTLAWRGGTETTDALEKTGGK